MADGKPKFDPNKPFEPVTETANKPAFDPSKPFEPAEESVKKKVATGTKSTTSLEPSGASSESKLPSASGSASPVKNKVGSVTDQERSAIQDFLNKPQEAPAAELAPPSPEQATQLIQQGQAPVDTANNILDNTHGQPGGLPEDIAQANEAVVANQNKINQEVKNELVGAFGKYNLKDEGSIQRYFNGYKNKGYNDVEIDNAKKDFFSSIGAALPVPPETSYAEGAVKSFDEGLAGIWRTLDNATILIDKALGTDGRSGTFENLATGLEQHAAKMKDVPEGVTGDIVKGVAGSIPFLYQVALTPELGIPKISSAMAANAFVNTLQETTKEKKDINLSDLVPAAGEAAGEGIKGGILHGLGYTSGVVGDMVKAVTESHAAGGITAAALNSLGFGGLEAAEEYAKTGSVDLSKVASAVGQGIVFSSGELKKAFTDAAKTKAVDNFFSADQKTINEVLKMNVDPVALREQSLKLGEAAEKTPEANKKNELLLAKKAIDKIIDINAMAKDVLKDPQAYIKDIKNNPDIPIEQKAPLIDHINKMANENDAKIQEGKPLSEQINKKKEELSALEEDGTLDPNIKAAKMAPIENDIKELSTKLQTIYDPKLKAELEEKAAKEAEKKSKSETPSEKKGQPEKTKTDETKKTEEAEVLTEQETAKPPAPEVEEAVSYNSATREVVKEPAPKKLSGKKLSELSDQELKDLGFSSIHEALNSTKKRVEGADDPALFAGDENTAATAETMPVEYVKAASKNRQEEAKVIADEERVKVAEGIDQKIKALEKSVFGTATKEAIDFKPKQTGEQNLVIPGATEFGKIQDKVFANRMSKFGEGLARQAEKMSVSDNKKARAVADIIRAIFPTSALTKGQIVRAEGFHGDINKATGDAAKINELLKDIVNNDKISLSKIDRVIDPEFYKELSKKEFKDKLTGDIGMDAYEQLSSKELDEMYTTYNEQFKKDGPVTYDDLTPAEKTVHDLVKQINDLTHDVSFATGGISHETYLENKDKYAGRLYDIFELPSDIQKSLDEQYNNATDKIFKQRKEVDDWKRLHKIEDPVYAAATRLRQVMINKAVYDYAGDIVKTKPEFVSDFEKPGFTKLADKGYGELSGKYVTQNIAEDFKGFFYQNETLNKFYDLLKRYDRWAPRQFYKKLFTVYNPGVHVGNIMGDNIFGFLAGIDPITLTSNLRFAKNEISEYGDTYRYLIKKGLLKSDLTRGDIVKSLDELYNAEQEAAVSKNPLKALLEKTKKVPGKAQSIYGGVDDLYKVSAFKSLVDGGYDAEKAVEIVAEGFQNYKRVGKLYDFTSKIPLVGQPFGKFAGDLARILKNAATKRPLSLIAFGASLHAISSLASHQSGETDKERELRENRPGAAKIPLPKILGGDISLDWLLKDKVLNVARFVSPLFVYGSVDESDDKLEAVKKMLPISIETVDRTNNPNGPTAVTIAKNINDPLLSWLQLFLDSDFRGKPILDPNATSYSKTTNSPEERIFNIMRFLGRQYIPYGALGDDLISAALGKEGYYNKRTVPQVLSRFMGVKLEDFPKDKYEQIRVNKIKAIQFQFKDNAEKLHRVRTLVKQGKINTSQANERIAPIMEDQVRLLNEVKN